MNLGRKISISGAALVMIGAGLGACGGGGSSANSTTATTSASGARAAVCQDVGTIARDVTASTVNTTTLKDDANRLSSDAEKLSDPQVAAAVNQFESTAAASDLVGFTSALSTIKKATC